MPETTADLAPPAGTAVGLGGSRRELDGAVHTVLGPDARLRPEQRDALRRLADGDVLLVARTGAGKTAVYAIATLLIGRPAVVVSPLLALQRDQVAALHEAGLRAAAASSAGGAARHRAALEGFAAGDLDALLLAPEQLARPDVVAAVEQAEPGLVVVDEAHCVSEWGHDFRPDYRHVTGLVERLGHPRVLAMTATASADVRRQIVEGLGMRDPAVVVHDADRPGIWLGVHHAATERERDALVIDLAAEEPGAVIVYARTKRHVESLAEALDAAGRPALRYHAGLPPKERQRVERTFLDGHADLVVATSAFGMGVDRADVRLVVHAGAPPSLEQYWQEVGRAGRDDEPARAVLVARAEDVALNRYLRGSAGPRRETLAAVLRCLGDEPMDRPALASATGLAARTLARALAELVDVDAVGRVGDRFLGTGTSVRDAAEAVAQRHEHRATLDRSRVELMRTYADTTDCRRRVLLELLGEEHPHVCGHCDSCDAGTSVEVHAGRLRPGQHVRHQAWGGGVVSVVEADRVTVLFESRGYVALDTAVALDSGVLTPDEPRAESA